MEEIKKRSALYVGSTGQIGVHNLIFKLVEEIRDIDDKVEISLVINNDNSLLYTCNKTAYLDNNHTIKIVEVLSDIFELSYLNEEQTSLQILFRPDKKIFEYENIDYNKLYNRFKELAQLNENIKIILEDDENKNIIQYCNGLETMLYENMYTHLGIEDSVPISINFTKDNIKVSLVMLLGYPVDVIISYANNAKTHGGGAHVQGLYDGVYMAFKKYLKEFMDSHINVERKDIVNDLNFVLHIKTNNLLYDGSCKRVLAGGNIRKTIKEGVMENLDNFLKSDKSFFDSSSIMRMEAFMQEFESTLKDRESEKDILLSNIDKLTTTELGLVRIKRNLDIETDDVILWCKNKIKEANSIIKKEGKNWYITNDNITITVNASSYGIITAHKEKD